MKKKLIICSLLLFAIFLLSGQGFAAEQGEILNIFDTVSPNGEDGVLLQEVTAVTGSQGEVLLPLYKNCTWNSYDVLAGNLEAEPEVVTYGDNTYMRLKFHEKETEISLTATINMEGVYELETADLGDTFPMNAYEISFKAANTSPVDIGNYTAQIASPDEYELLNIIGYKSKKPYSIHTDNGLVYAKYEFGGIDSGEESKLEINVKEVSPKGKWVIWLAGALLAGFSMLKNRDLLEKAKLMKKKKKEEA